MCVPPTKGILPLPCNSGGGRRGLGGREAACLIPARWGWETHTHHTHTGCSLSVPALPVGLAPPCLRPEGAFPAPSSPFPPKGGLQGGGCPASQQAASARRRTDRQTDGRREKTLTD